jgi:capsular exopolysaccharide synthesis family protein
MGINDYLTALRRRWSIVVVAGLLGLLIGYVVAPGVAKQANGPGSSSATATLLQSPDVNYPVASTALLVTSETVAERVSAMLHTQAAPQQLLQQVASTSDKGSNSIKITTVAAEPQAAVALANAFAMGTLDEFRVRRNAAATTQFKTLENQLTDVNNQLKQAGPMAAASANPQVAALSARYSEIYRSLQNIANQANGPSGLEILNPATVAASPAAVLSLSSTTLTVLGLALGLVLGGMLALALEHFDTRPRDRAGARRAYRLPVLAEIPKVRDSDRRDYAVVTVSQPDNDAAEAYRSLRSTIMITDSRIHHLGDEGIALNGSAGNTTQRPQVILVASACAEEGKTSTVVNLAACFADVGKRVLVLDCDFRGPDAHQYLGVSPGTGLSNLLTGTTAGELAQHVRRSDIPCVDIITAGTQLERPSTLPAQMGGMVTQARELADIVLIDSTPMLLANDAMDLMPYIDTVLVVSYVGRATSEQAQRASELLARTRAPVVGLALVGVTGPSYRDLRSYSHGTRSDLMRMDPSPRPSPHMTAPTPANGTIAQNRES